MSLRVCSTLSTVLLSLALASTATAEKKTHKAHKATPAKVSTKPAAAQSDNAAAVPAEEPLMPDDKVWEKPPVEQEKPALPPPARVKRTTGDGRNASLGLVLGYGFKTDRRIKELIGTDPYGLALGLQGGYTFDMKLYVGLYFTYYLGSSNTGPTAQIGGSSSVKASYVHFGAEIGYDAWIGPVVVRPSLQLGPALALTDQSGPTTTVNSMMFGPGLTVFAPIKAFYIGGEMRFNLLTGDGVGAILLAANGGVRF